MIVEDKKIEKVCGFYVSDFHLEMILVPYINKKLEKQENIIIETENDLSQTVEILMSKMNLKEDSKEKILNLGWNSKSNKEIQDKSNIIIIGSENYIKNKNNEIKNMEVNDLTVIDCYNFEEVKNDINNIVNSHSNSLNTMGIEKI